MLELIQKIKLHTEAGSILEHMYLLDLLETNAKALEAINAKRIVNGMNTIGDDGIVVNDTHSFRDEVDKMRKD